MNYQQPIDIQMFMKPNVIAGIFLLVKCVNLFQKPLYFVNFLTHIKFKNELSFKVHVQMFLFLQAHVFCLALERHGYVLGLLFYAVTLLAQKNLPNSGIGKVKQKIVECLANLKIWVLFEACLGDHSQTPNAQHYLQAGSAV